MTNPTSERVQSRYINSLKFTKETYRIVLYLYLRPHEVVPGLEMAIVGLLVSIVCAIIVGIQFDYNHITSAIFENPFLVIIFLIVFAIFGIFQFVCGFKMAIGLRRPKWGSERWNLRESYTMEKLSLETTNSLAFYPCVIDYYVTLPFLFSRLTGGWLTTTWDNTPYLYDEIPYLVPTKKELSPKDPNNVPEFINFSATFFEEYFLKGHSDKTEYKYGDIFDIVEYKKVPDYALIRMNDEETEILIKKDAFNGDSWDDVKEFILNRQEEQKKLIKQEKKKNRKKRFKHD